ncbi:MAG: hypothetical protein JRJ82_19220 [Deltaproteobacteria bacterium]|nr:hypothetical protein [Deltaproteobacteria bacterium]
MNYTPQGGAIEGNAADDTLMVDQGGYFPIDSGACFRYLIVPIKTAPERY